MAHVSQGPLADEGQRWKVAERPCPTAGKEGQGDAGTQAFGRLSSHFRAPTPAESLALPGAELVCNISNWADVSALCGT